MTKDKKRNIIIGSLCAVVLLMAVGYAAFQTVLNISGTSNITSNWNIKITDVTTKNIKGTASNKEEPTFTDTTATFKTNLQSPGDSLEYEVTVTNAGNLNAKVDEVTLSDTNNPAIKFTSSGITKGDVINAGSTGTLLVKVEYLESVTSQPTNTTSDLTVTLDYSQAIGNTPSGESAADKLIATAVTTGDGLYEDTYEPGRYVYKGANPSNYITFNGESFRIISVEADGTLKIRKKDFIDELAFDTSNSNNWLRPATLNTYLNNDYYNGLSADVQSQIQSHVFGVGAVMKDNDDLAGQIASENGTSWSGNIGLISVSDYLRANTNTSQCGTLLKNNNSIYGNEDNGWQMSSTCCQTNFLCTDLTYNDDYWTISPNNTTEQYIVDGYGGVSPIEANSTTAAAMNTIKVFPVLYLKSDITLTGDGTASNPYTIE